MAGRRHDRNMRVAEIGEKGQAAIDASSVLVIGAGGLGSPAALYLAAAGIGTLGIADGDTVDETNLNRQIVHSDADIGRRKTESAADRITALNPTIVVRRHQVVVTKANIGSVIADYDFVIDAVDNFPGKYAINDACVEAGKPFCHAGVLAWSGQIMTYVPGSACLRCFRPDEPSAEDAGSALESGIVGAVAGHIGSMQAIEAVKYLVGAGGLLANRMLFFDGLTARHRILAIGRRPDCPICNQTREESTWTTC